MNQLLTLLKKNLILGDGAMGTILNQRVSGVTCPEAVNFSHEGIIESIHRDYIEAGSMMIQTNSFGGSRIKLDAYGLSDDVISINRKAASIARKAAGELILVAGNIGPTGKLMEPLGELTFDSAVSFFEEQAKALAEGGCDVFLIETMADLQEAKAAVIGVKKAADLPVICTMTFDIQQRTLTGADPETVVTVLEALDVDVVGANCGVGPDLMVSIISRMRNVSDTPLMAQANAGLPRLVENQTIYDMTSDLMKDFIPQLIESGAAIVGGCCGTTPEHIGAFAAELKKLKPKAINRIDFSKLSGTDQTIYIGKGYRTPIIGENINPTSRKYLADAFRNNHTKPAVEEAEAQVLAGASVIDINTGASGVDQESVMPLTIKAVQKNIHVPISIDSSDERVSEAGLKVVRGKPLLNSTTAEAEKMEKMVKLAKTYGAALLCLTLDGSGIPETAEERYRIAEIMVRYALEQGLDQRDIWVDPLTLTAGAQQNLVMESIKAVQMIKERLGVRTILGVSNISHGLPERKGLTASFMAMALGAGLDMPIINPREPLFQLVRSGSDVLTGKDQNAKHYLYENRKKDKNEVTEEKPRIKKETEASEPSLKEQILRGDADGIEHLIEDLLTGGMDGLEIINQMITPALEKVGAHYEDGTFFLPQLLMSAETAQKAFGILKEKLPQSASSYVGTIVLATVKGDIHDIGKNIVSVMLENHGFRVIDLGKDVDPDLILRTALEESADMIGLSALMTTTMQQMAVVAEKIRDMDHPIPLLVGGAVLTEEYAKSIGAKYAPDAVQAVKKAKGIIAG